MCQGMYNFLFFTKFSSNFLHFNRGMCQPSYAHRSLIKKRSLDQTILCARTTVYISLSCILAGPGGRWGNYTSSDIALSTRHQLIRITYSCSSSGCCQGYFCLDRDCSPLRDTAKHLPLAKTSWVTKKICQKSKIFTRTHRLHMPFSQIHSFSL